MTTEAPTAAPAPRPSLRPADGGRLGGVTLTLFLLDLASKQWVQDFSGLPHGVYPPYGGWEIIPGFFSIVYATNHGAAWGLLAGMGWLLIGLAVLATGAIIWFRHSLGLAQVRFQIIFGLILGGILGNTLDRIRYGYVIDFIDVHLGFYRWPTFNLADCGIVVGTLLYAIFTWQSETRAKPAASASALK